MEHQPPWQQPRSWSDATDGSGYPTDTAVFNAPGNGTTTVSIPDSELPLNVASITFNGSGMYHVVNSSGDGNDGYLCLGPAPASGPAVITTNTNAEIDATIETNSADVVLTKSGNATLYITTSNGYGAFENGITAINVNQGTLKFANGALNVFV